MWQLFQRWFTSWRRREPVHSRQANIRVIEVSVNSAKCLAHEWCVHVCPAVFEMGEGWSAQAKADAKDHFESRKALILRAKDECPTDAIRVQVEDESQ